MLEQQSGKRRGARFLVVVDVQADASRTLDFLAAPQGINPSIKFLRIGAAGPLVAPGAARIRRTLRYEEAPAAADYREVWLGEGDAAISAKIALVR